MDTQMVKFKSDTGQEVQVTAQDVRNLICQRATEQEVALFLAHCKSHRLDPFTKEAYLVKYGDKPAAIITNYNMFNARAQMHDDYLGIEDGVVILTKDGGVEHRPGSAVYKALDERLLGGWARVLRRDKEPTYVELALEDYSTGLAKWKTSPGLMINKCAKSAAWRTAYPGEFNGMYSAEEMDQATQGTVEVQATVVKSVDYLQPIRDLFKTFRDALGLDKNEAMAAICAEARVSDMHAMDAATAQRIVQWMRARIESLPTEPEPEPQEAQADDYEISDDDLLGDF